MNMLSPAEITQYASDVWYKKTNDSLSATIVSSVLAGIYIAMWGFFSVNSITWLAWAVPFGIIKLISWLAFSLGLILVVVAWAQLFTGNALLIISLLDKKISVFAFLKNLFSVYLFNFLWAIILVWLLYLGGWHTFDGWNISKTIVDIWLHKVSYWFVQALALGILCNILVCLGVWLAYSGKTVVDKIVWIVFPITAFVAWWFEHSIANMFYLPFAYILQESNLITIKSILIKNLLPVTIWNIIWWALFVGFLYRFLYKSNK